MSLLSLYNLKSRFVSREVGNELVIVPLTGNVAQMNELFTLNETAKFIWENIQENSTIADIENAMTNEFDIDNEKARTDIENFLIKLESMLNKSVRK